jgi:hypothetical protein
MFRLVKFFWPDLPNERLMSRVKLADRPLKYSALMKDDQDQIFHGID